MARKDSPQRVKQVLIRRRDALRQTLQGELERLSTSDEPVVGDNADLAVDSDYAAVNSQLAETESRELAHIQHALERISEGSYGRCETCGKRIRLARLRALPYASNCIRCQSAAEGSPAEPSFAAHWSRLADDEQADDSQHPSIKLMTVD